MPIRLHKRSVDYLEVLKAELVGNLQAEFGPAKNLVAERPARYEAGRPSEGAFRLFAIAGQNWYRPMTELQKSAGLTRYEDMKTFREELLRCGYATVHRVKTGNEKKSIMVMLPTALGIERLREAGVKFMPVVGDAPHGPDGDATHIYYQNTIAAWLQARGWVVEIEMQLHDKRVDVGALRQGEAHAYEVVNVDLGKELTNLTKDLADGWHKVVFCVANSKIQNELSELIEAELGNSMLENVEFRPLGSFQ